MTPILDKMLHTVIIKTYGVGINPFTSLLWGFLLMVPKIQKTKPRDSEIHMALRTAFYEVLDDSHRGFDHIIAEIFERCDVENQSPIDEDWLEQRITIAYGEEELATIKINREQLLNDLQNFASQGNGVVIGSPGVGKTYLLKELCQNLKSDEIPHLLLPIDQLGDGTDETLQRELSYEGDLIDKLKSVYVSGKKGILLFDAFDAARNEGTRKSFLNA